MKGESRFASLRWLRRATAALLVLSLLAVLVLSQAVQVRIGRVSYEQNDVSGAVNYLVDSTAYLGRSVPGRVLQLLGASLPGREDLASAYTLASVHIGRREYPRALEYIEQCLRLYAGRDPSVLADLWFKKGCLLTLCERDEEALAALDRALAAVPALADVHYVKMQIHVKQGQLAAAVRDVEMYRRAAGRDDISAVQGDLYAAQEVYGEAVAAYERALQANPGDWHARFMRGLCQLQLGRHEASLADFTQCIREGRETALSRYYRGVLLLNAGDYAAAEEDFDAALAENMPGSALMELWFNRGVSRMAQGRLNAARDDFERSAARGEAAGESLINSGICLQELGQPEQALERFDLAEREGIAAERLAYYRARSYAVLSRFDEADQAYTACIQGGYEVMECTLRRGAARYALGRHEEAVRDFTVCISAGYGQSEALYYRGMAYAMLGQGELSQRDLEDALAMGRT